MTLADLGFHYWTDARSGPGWYYVHADYPDEGSTFLGAKFYAAAWYPHALGAVVCTTNAEEARCQVTRGPW